MLRICMVVVLVAAWTTPVFAQGLPSTRLSLKRVPPNLSQRVTDSARGPLTTRSKLLKPQTPLTFAVRDVRAFDHPTPDQSASVLKRMNDLEAAIISARSPVNGTTPDSKQVFASLRDVRSRAAEPLKRDLTNLLIAGLVETMTDHLDAGGNVVKLKTTTWGYLSLDQRGTDWGPVIEFEPNTVQLIPVLNLLDKNELQNATVPDFAVVDPVRTGPDPDVAMNCPHDFDVINLHTHGLNVSPRWPADDIFRRIGPGQLKFFIYQIPPNQPAGTYFYHPHNHGSVADQVAGGMAGPLIVRDTSRGLDALGEKKGWGADSESIVMFQQLTLYKENAEGDNRFTRPDFFALKDMDLNLAVGVMDRPDIREVALRLNPPDGQPIKRLDAVETWVSGAFQPTLGSPWSPGEVRRLRLIHAGVEENINFTIEAPDPNLPRPLIQVIAWDGIPLEEPYLITEMRQLVLSPGNRADVLVVFPLQGLAEAGPDDLTYAVVQRGAEPSSANALAYLTVRPGTPFSGNGLLMTAEEAKAVFEACAPAPPSVPTGDVVGFDLSFADASLDPIEGNPLRSTFTPGTFQINRKPFPDDQKYFRLNQPSRLSFGILQGSATHPLHIHVNPFRLDPDANRGQQGLPTGTFWADTLLVHPETPVDVIMPFSNWTGDSVAHCHILDHEDAGMMNVIHVSPEVLAWPEFPLHGAFDRSWLTKHQLDQLKPVWPKAGGRVEANQSDVVTLLVFMPAERDGAACQHCAQAVKQVAELRKRTPGDRSLRIIAVSAATNDKLPSTAALGLLEGVDQVCSDPDLRAFEVFSLLDGTPRIDGQGEVSFPEVFVPGTRIPRSSHDVMHGVFVVDPRGRVVSIRRGFVAPNDAEQILRESALAHQGHEAILKAFDARLNAEKNAASTRHRRSIYELQESQFNSR